MSHHTISKTEKKMRFSTAIILVCVASCTLAQDPPVAPMNGQYYYSNGTHPGHPGSYRGTGYFDLESDIVTTQYAEVNWDSHTVQIPPDVAAKLKGKLVSFTGYEFDLIRVLPNGTEVSAHVSQDGQLFEVYNTNT